MIKIFFSFMIFGKWLKLKRKAAKMTQKQVAEKATAFGHKVSDAYISTIERGYDTDKEGNPTRITEKLAEAIAYALGIPADEARLAAGLAPKNAFNLYVEIAKLNLSVFGEQQINEIVGYIKYRAQNPIEVLTKEEIERDYGLKPAEIIKLKDKKQVLEADTEIDLAKPKRKAK